MKLLATICHRFKLYYLCSRKHCLLDKCNKETFVNINNMNGI